jgi:hypothetical protein
MLVLVSKINDDAESYKWVNQFPNVLIYNKSDVIIDESINSINIAKIGYHNHSLYHYIYNNYDSLPDNLLFISLYDELYDANTYPNPNLIQKIWNYINDTNIVIDFESISFYKNIIDLNAVLNAEDDANKELDILNIQNTFNNCYLQLFGQFEESVIEYGEGSNYFISKSAILSRSREFYKIILDFIEIEDNNFFYERSFIEPLTEKIFTGKFTPFIESYSIIENMNKEIDSIDESGIECECDNECDMECDMECNMEGDCNVVCESESDCDSESSSESESELKAPEIRFKPKKGYCDFCNKIENTQKPLIPITYYCSEECAKLSNQNDII